MAGSQDQSLAALLRRATIDDHEEVLKAANNALKKSKGDLTAQHIRLVALVKLDRHEDALRALEEGGDPLKSRAKFEHAYVLYKRHRLEEARQVVLSCPSSLSISHLEAQIAYRAEDFSHSAELYERLSQQSRGQNEDVRINKTAINAQLLWSGQEGILKGTKPEREDLEQFDTTFNFACSCIARGQFKEAEIYLRMAKDLCNATDELSDEDKQSELIPITVQQIYVLSRLGKLKEAEQLSSTIELQKITDQTTKHIAQTNTFIADTQPNNPYLIDRQCRSMASLSPLDPPFTFQKFSLSRNNATLNLMTNKHNAFRSSANTASEAWTGVCRAAAHAKESDPKKALHRLAPLLKKHPKDIGLLLTVIQLYAVTNNIEAAAASLETSLDELEKSSNPEEQNISFTPGLVSISMLLAAIQGRTYYMKQRIDKASTYWKEKAETDFSKRICTYGGSILSDTFSTADLKKGADLFQTIRVNHPHDDTATLGLFASLDPSTPASGVPDTGNVPTGSELTSNVDVEALETAGIARMPILSKKSSTSRKRRTEPPKKADKPKKPRKSTFPKDYDPNKKPDPERWLPLRERSNWRPKGKKKGKAGGAGAGGGMTQGGMVSEDSRPATPSQQQQKGNVQTKSKKKKGKGGK